METVDNAFKVYFKFVRETESFWNVLMQETNKPLNAIINQCEQLQYASRAQLSEEFLQRFPDVMQKLCGKLHVNIEEEMAVISNIVEKMQSKADDLQVKLIAVEKALEKMGSVDITSESNPLRPPLWSLMEFAVDSWRYYHSLCLKANFACACIVYTEQESVENMKRAFEVDQSSKKYMYNMNISEKSKFFRCNWSGPSDQSSTCLVILHTVVTWKA